MNIIIGKIVAHDRATVIATEGDVETRGTTIITKYPDGTETNISDEKIITTGKPEWQCPNCGRINDSDHATCEGCGSTREKFRDELLDDKKDRRRKRRVERDNEPDGKPPNIIVDGDRTLNIAWEIHRDHPKGPGDVDIILGD